MEQSDSSSVRLRIESADSSNAGQYLCYGFPSDRSTYAVKTFNVVIEGASGGDDNNRPPVDPSQPDDKVKTADIDSTVDLACEYSSEDSTDLKWRKLDGVSLGII